MLRSVYRVGPGAKTAIDVLRTGYKFLDTQAGRETQSGLSTSTQQNTLRPFVGAIRHELVTRLASITKNRLPHGRYQSKHRHTPH
jgi:hypothetical protein